MSEYLCVVHMPAERAPQRIPMRAECRIEFAEALSEIIQTWPGFDRLEVYDHRGRVVTQMRGEAPLMAAE